MIRVVHPGSGPDFYPPKISNPGVKKAPDSGSGSATLIWSGHWIFLYHRYMGKKIYSLCVKCWIFKEWKRIPDPDIYKKQYPASRAETVFFLDGPILCVFHSNLFSLPLSRIVFIFFHFPGGPGQWVKAAAVVSVSSQVAGFAPSPAQHKRSQITCRFFLQCSGS